jgi:aminoglycoside 6'-N-acetyltransferase I
MLIESLSIDNIKPFTELSLELWPKCNFDEEYEQYLRRIDSARDACYLAKVGELYVGFVHLAIRHDYVEGADELPIAYIEGIYVKPEHQTRGIARKLIGKGEEWAREKGLKQIASDTELVNSASINFHMQMGFKETGRIVCFIKGL